jgi:hypothetical protein
LEIRFDPAKERELTAAALALANALHADKTIVAVNTGIPKAIQMRLTEIFSLL